MPCSCDARVPGSWLARHSQPLPPAVQGHIGRETVRGEAEGRPQDKLCGRRALGSEEQDGARLVPRPPCLELHRQPLPGMCSGERHPRRCAQAAKMMLAGHFQTLGDACRIDGLDPREKCAPVPLISPRAMARRAPRRPLPAIAQQTLSEHSANAPPRPVRYVAPLTSAQEIGWRAPSKSNPRPSLELFGVCQHGRKDKIKTLFDMVP